MTVQEVMAKWNISEPTAQFISDRMGQIPPIEEFPANVPDEDLVQIVMKQDDLDKEDAALEVQFARNPMPTYLREETILEI